MISLKNYIIKKRQKKLSIFILTFIILSICGYIINFNMLALLKGQASMLDLLKRIISPDLSYIYEVMWSLLETLEITFLATTAGVIISVFLAVLVSANASPSILLSKFINIILAILRTIPSLVWAAFLVSMFSVGKFSGIIASLIIATLIGTRLFREEIDNITQETIDSVKSTGASGFQVLKYAIIPSIKTNIVSVYFIILESTLRGATVLGLVGAGGIGQIMWRDLNTFKYNRVATIILMMFLMIYIFDYLSVFFRTHLDKINITNTNLTSYRKKEKYRRIFTPIFIILIFYSIYATLNIPSERFKLGLHQGGYIFKNLLSIDISYAHKMFGALAQSLGIAIFATIVGSAFSFILVGLSAQNINHKKILTWILKALTNILRTFPPVIGAIMFFRGVGPGAMAGALALTMYTTGVLSKLYCESVESIPKEVITSLEVTGADNVQIYTKGIFPYSRATFLSLALYRMESNIRNSTVLGLVGAGGIGTLLSANIQWRNWNRVGMLLLGAGIMIIIFDSLSRYLRKNLSQN